ncbi:hypothetical protein GCM10011512_07530 [Tersicoccus solisilvae]|uniref:histidine kinase n=1 Tax=Tersicoccus solisilvae TaxID=1882339 RepID=A0ABQ1NUT0_9MICC|nr:histidine kinase [Tersicoccus solisilvae]GGC83261.1 hypothetical protein GCM10011512_07530 [Tersicoccus solisilvae]
MVISLDRLPQRRSDWWIRVSVVGVVCSIILAVFPSTWGDATVLLGWAVGGATVISAAVISFRHPVAAVSAVTVLVALQVLLILPPIAGGLYGDALFAAILLVLLLSVGASTARSHGPTLICALAVLLAVLSAGIHVASWSGRLDLVSSVVLGMSREPIDLRDTVLAQGDWVRDQIVQASIGRLFLVAVVIGVGLLVRAAVRAGVTRRQLAAAHAEIHERDARSALVDQRRRIAADVHDVLAHSLTVIVAQGEGALVSEEPVRSESLGRLVEVARSSLRDVRGMIERLDDACTDVPAPGLDDLPRLLQTFSDAGLRVTADEHGTARGLGDASQLAVYRIVQESLTNVLKHGGRGSAALVTLDWRGSAPDLLLTVTSISRREAAVTTNPGEAGHPADGVAGVGLSSMQTRAEMTGGWLTAGPADGGWSVTAQIPTQELALEVLR